MTTTDLWEETHRALCAKRWSIARRLLDDLGRRNDNRDQLSSAESYGVPSELLGVIGDRIELVNAKVS